MSKTRLAWLVSLMLPALAPPAGATVLIPVDVPVLSREAATIVRGLVVATEALWVGREIETVVTLEVEASLKGANESVVQFRVPGGQVGRYRRLVPGAPAFAQGQRVVVFLAAASASVPHLVGFSQGVFRVETTTVGYRVTPPIATGPDGRIVRGDPNRRPLTLGEFERQVRQFVEAAR